MKKRIMFVCSAGMSTSMLVARTLKAAEKRGLDLDIFALAEAEAKKQYDDCDLILLGPQVRFLLNGIKKAVEGKNIPVYVIDQIAYGRMDGEAVLAQILKSI